MSASEPHFNFKTISSQLNEEDRLIVKNLTELINYLYQRKIDKLSVFYANIFETVNYLFVVFDKKTMTYRSSPDFLINTLKEINFYNNPDYKKLLFTLFPTLDAPEIAAEIEGFFITKNLKKSVKNTPNKL